jgi:hypothetical protein
MTWRGGEREIISRIPYLDDPKGRPRLVRAFLYLS